ncbi:glycosyltransferase family 2 protein [Caminibacter pacificus]|uniref:Dolichol-phosphate mannosyltransferase n=1 Tax=Caminibacter pacificus TaxID=1424653 RepID=A0AAJ4RCZ7_9BACT|nr:glycosyltransferase family 2 protein [Caminibacter pacificus]QCI27562.1 glycosyltransferase family 2 protein [Caminibacter pacificus]ROR40260.1 dolichol-phosphate mannosyltransferase [Caminibacter pacificus]
MKLSVVVPLMNEEDNIKYLIEEVDKALKDFDYELILVDDGSTDNTVEEIKKHMNDKTKLVILNRNYGQTSAMAAGIEVASGDIIVTIDGDLQNDPSDIPMMIEKLNEGYDVVAGIRAKRKDEPFRKFLSKIANKIIRKVTGVHITDYGCTLKVFKKDVAKNLQLYGELHRFIPILAEMYGAKITEVPVKHHERKFGKSKYGFNRTFKVISDLMYLVFMQRFGQKPMHFFGTVGFIMFSLGVLIDFYLLILKLFGQSIGGRPLLTLGTMLILGGIQLITTGFLAEIMIRTYYESQGKKPYVIKEIVTKDSQMRVES